MTSSTGPASLPLTPTQLAMLLHHLADPRRGLDIEQVLVRLDESVNPDRLRQAWQRAVDRHEALRTRFQWEGVGEPWQEIMAQASLPFALHDWQHLDTAAQETALRDWMVQDRRRGFDLREAPCMRVNLFQLGPQRWNCVWTVHHIVCDGRSFPLVLDEVLAPPDDAQNGSTAPAPARFAAHVHHLSTLDQASALGFWRQRLAGLREATALPGGPPEGVPAGRGQVGRVLQQELTAQLHTFARTHGVGLNTLVQAAWAVLLARHGGGDDIVFGAVRAGRGSSVPQAPTIVGCLINTLPVRVRMNDEDRLSAWLQALRDSERAVRPHEHAALVAIQAGSELPAGQSLFDSLLVFDHLSLEGQMQARGPRHAGRRFELHEHTGYPLTLYAYDGAAIELQLAFDEPRFDAAWAQRLLERLATLLEGMLQDPQQTVGSLPMLPAQEKHAVLHDWNDTATPVRDHLCIHQEIEAQAARQPDATAVIFRDAALTYAELNARANRLAHQLRGFGVGPDVPVALCLERSPDLLVAILGVHKAGGCYLPLDPAYPRERLGLKLRDAQAPVLLTQGSLLHVLPPHGARVVRMDDEASRAGLPAENPVPVASPAHLAYLIYTSGSTGTPKGVMVEHRQVQNFFAGMDAVIPMRRDATSRPGTWLAVTSLSFDISVLELLWTLARGMRIVLHENQHRAAALATRTGRHADRAVDFSLMYFASADSAGANKYRLLLEGARFADANGFSAIWTPERHFHAFGGLYPNPSVTSAALATITRRIQLRAGSVVNHLHHPARIAEEWGLVDNLSGGRVGISFAAGWQPRDFVLAPDAHGQPREALLAHIDQVRRLWRGEALTLPGPKGQPYEIRTLPRPVQPELPFWLTAAGSPDTFATAGRLGAGVLTHLLGQGIEEVAQKIALYRQAWREAGHAGNGHVTLMLHTFIGDDIDAVRETVRQPMVQYLRSSLNLVKGFAQSWTAFKKRADGSTHMDVDLDTLTPDELDGLLAYSFERYFETSALFGDLDRALEMVDRVKGMGVDEIACLIDFGVDEETTLQHLRHLDRLRQLAQPAATVALPDASQDIGAQIVRHGVTHLQCTPSLAGMLLQDARTREAFGRLQVMLVGGEALPATLAAELQAAGVPTLLNMYGPTETTVWSASHPVAGHEDPIPIGRPIANTVVRLLDSGGRLAPVGVAGELCIGGAGVTRGYWRRPELTAERFVPDPFDASGQARLYRTGDLARWRADGVIEFLGRADHQVKIRGHRIELGEIESALATHAQVREAVVIARNDDAMETRLVAYVVPQDLADAPTASTLKAHLRERLPDIMVPAAYVCLTAFPQTPNRKIDRKALPAPTADPAPAGLPAPTGPHAPTGDMEATVARVWQEVLRLPHVGRDDNFFDLGGHSLLAVQVHRRLGEATGRAIPMTDLFRFPTVRSLAAHLGAGAAPSGAPAGSIQSGLAAAEQRRRALAARRGRTSP